MNFYFPLPFGKNTEIISVSINTYFVISWIWIHLCWFLLFVGTSFIIYSYLKSFTMVISWPCFGWHNIPILVMLLVCFYFIFWSASGLLLIFFWSASPAFFGLLPTLIVIDIFQKAIYTINLVCFKFGWSRLEIQKYP